MKVLGSQTYSVQKNPCQGNSRELAMWVGYPPLAPGKQEGKLISSDDCNTSVSRATL